MRVVNRTTVRIERAIGSYYRVTISSNVNGEVEPAWVETYHDLLWTEVVDVVLEELDGRRPGWALDEGRRFAQPDFWSVDDPMVAYGDVE